MERIVGFDTARTVNNSPHPMSPQIFRRIFPKFAAALLLGLPIMSLAQPTVSITAEHSPIATPAKKTHTIAITFANGVWNYTISPAQPNAKVAKVKRGDTLNWISTNGNWTVFFKNGTTPLDDSSGNPILTINGPSGNSNGGSVAVKHSSGTSFTYGVRLKLNGSGQIVEDDPEIIIE